MSGRTVATILAFLLLPTTAVPGTGGGVVTGYVPFHSGEAAIFLFRTETVSTDSPSCNTTNRFAIAEADPKYRETVAAIMSAHAQGLPVHAVGLGTCNVWSNSEDLHYVCVGNATC